MILRYALNHNNVLICSTLCSIRSPMTIEKGMNKRRKQISVFFKIYPIMQQIGKQDLFLDS